MVNISGRRIIYLLFITGAMAVIACNERGNQSPKPGTLPSPAVPVIVPQDSITAKNQPDSSIPPTSCASSGSGRVVTVSDLESVAPVSLPQPSFTASYTKGKNVKNAKLRLSFIAKNHVTDLPQWFDNNELTYPAYDIYPGYSTGMKVPSQVPRTYRKQKLVSGIKQDGYSIFIYGKDFSHGRYMVITNADAGKILHVLDFENFAQAPRNTKDQFVYQRPVWARVEDNILYVSNAHWTYAKSSGGHNAYLSAIDLENYRLLWRSAPLTSSRNFEILGDLIVCGYGFTAEPDYLYVLNKYTGRPIQKLQLNDAPQYIVEKENRIYVRSHNTDQVFEWE